jgi:hypothetical protein
MLVKFTDNFESNLETIEIFWTECQFPLGYDRLLDELEQTLIPNLERFPMLGRPFISLQPDSVEATNLQDKLREKLAQMEGNNDVRQYHTQDYLILYAIINEVIYLLSIKHHKQLSFDFNRLWVDRI